MTDIGEAAKLKTLPPTPDYGKEALGLILAFDRPPTRGLCCTVEPEAVVTTTGVV